MEARSNQEADVIPIGTDEDPWNKYEILGKIGEGTYGNVYKAKERHTGKLVAAKIIPASGDERGLAELSEEIRLLERCEHPNVVSYYDSFFGEGNLWIIMEYCGGGSVSDVLHIRGQGLDEMQISYVCKEALKGLEYLHGMNRLHRDIKCSNIVFTEDGDVKLVDLGIASQLTNTLSKRNTFIGTPHWMAPEVIQESRYDGKVDVWGIGISAIEMAEMIPPRWNVHPMRVIFVISRDPPPTLREPKKWSPEFSEFLRCCLQKDCHLRLEASELLEHEFFKYASPKDTIIASLIPSIERYRAELDVSMQSATPVLLCRPFDHTADSAGHLSWRGTARTGASHALSGSPASSDTEPFIRSIFSRVPTESGKATVICKDLGGESPRESAGGLDFGLAIQSMLGHTDEADMNLFSTELMRWYETKNDDWLPVLSVHSKAAEDYLTKYDFDFNGEVDALARELLGLQGVDCTKEYLQEMAQKYLQCGTLHNLFHQYSALHFQLAFYNTTKGKSQETQRDIRRYQDILRYILLSRSPTDRTLR